MHKIITLSLFVFLTAIAISNVVNAQENTPSAKEVQIYKRDIKRIEKYLNGIKTLIAPFSQVDSDGNETDGTFYLSRPGKLRWEYNPPNPVLIIAKGSLLTYYDSELDQLSHIGLDDNISGFLTRSHINFSDENVEVIRFDKTDSEIRVTVAQKGKETEGELTLVFNSRVSELKRMEILDAIGKRTRVTFTTLIYDKPLDKKLFNLPNIRKKQER